jgi:hypothetical protein
MPHIHTQSLTYVLCMHVQSTVSHYSLLELLHISHTQSLTHVLCMHVQSNLQGGVALLVSVAGLLTNAALIAIVSESFSDKLEQLKRVILKPLPTHIWVF